METSKVPLPNLFTEAFNLLEAIGLHPKMVSFSLKCVVMVMVYCMLSIASVYGSVQQALLCPSLGDRVANVAYAVGVVQAST